MKQFFLNLSIALFFFASVALAASWPEASLWNGVWWAGIFYLLISIFFLLVANVFYRIAKQHSKTMGKKCRFWGYVMLFVSGYVLGGFHPIILIMNEQNPGWVVILIVSTMFFLSWLFKKAGDGYNP